jgi:hypothetical protein
MISMFKPNPLSEGLLLICQISSKSFYLSIVNILIPFSLSLTPQQNKLDFLSLKMF